MAKPMRGETPPRTEFWTRDRVHPNSDVWHAHLGGCDWVLRKNTRADRPGYFLYGIDPSGEVTSGEWMGSRVGPARRAGEQWITKPWTRDAIRQALGSGPAITPEVEQ